MARESWVPKEHERELFHEIYIDETSQNDHRFLVLGGIVIPREFYAEFESDIFEARPSRLRFDSKGNPRELGWSEISKGDFDNYAKVLEAYFTFAFRKAKGRRGVFGFFCSVINTQVKGLNVTRGKRGQIGFDREIYSHCMHIGRIHRRELFHVYPDNRSTTEDEKELAFMLSRGIRRKGDERDHPFRRVEFRYSHEHQALQISDILIGAVAYRLNRHYDKPDANIDKKRLCDLVMQKTKFDGCIIDNRKLRPRTFGTNQLWYRSGLGKP